MGRPFKGTAPISMYTHAKRLGILFFAKVSVFNFSCSAEISSIYASTASLFSSVNFLSVRVHRNTGDTLIMGGSSGGKKKTTQS
jgi:hypothetical protein